MNQQTIAIIASVVVFALIIIFKVREWIIMHGEPGKGKYYTTTATTEEPRPIFVEFIAEIEEVDRNGNLVKLEGLTYPDKLIPVEWGHHKDARSEGTYRLKDNSLLIHSKVDERILDLTPAIALQIKRSHQNAFGGITIEEARLTSVSLSMSPNANPNIKSLREQLKQQEDDRRK